MSKDHVLLVIDDSNSVILTVPIRLRVLISVVVLVVGVPWLIGFGAKLSVRVELSRLQATHAMLQAENANYRGAAGAFTAQLRSLAGVVNTLQVTDNSGVLENAHRAAPTAPSAASTFVSAALLPSFASPQDLYGALRSVLEILASRLPSIEQRVERREALAAAAPSIWPVEGWLTAAFGQRSDPLTGELGFHQGIDISRPEGEPVYATGDGVVETASYSGDYGNLVVVEHDFGLSTRYGHLSRFAVSAGATIKRGTVVGYVGATGRVTGAHLHYEILANGTPIDPLRILSQQP